MTRRRGGSRAVSHAPFESFSETSTRHARVIQVVDNRLEACPTSGSLGPPRFFLERACVPPVAHAEIEAGVFEARIPSLKSFRLLSS